MQAQGYPSSPEVSVWKNSKASLPLLYLLGRLRRSPLRDAAGPNLSPLAPEALERLELGLESKNGAAW